MNSNHVTYIEAKDNLGNMLLHTTITFVSGPFEYFVTKVPGGWIYNTLKGGDGVFVSQFAPSPYCRSIDNN